MVQVLSRLRGHNEDAKAEPYKADEHIVPFPSHVPCLSALSPTPLIEGETGAQSEAFGAVSSNARIWMEFIPSPALGPVSQSMLNSLNFEYF